MATYAARRTSQPTDGGDAGSHGGSRRHEGWWGIVFVIGNLLCQSAVALPATTHTTDFIAAYYADHRTAISLTQLGELIITVFLWRFVRALAAIQPDPGRTRLLRGCAWALAACSVLTSAPVLALALVSHPSQGVTRRLASATDLSDVLLFAVVVVFGYACTGRGNPPWFRICGWALAAVALARVVLYFFGLDVLDNAAALGFMVIILAYSVWLLRRARPARGIADPAGD